MSEGKIHGSRSSIATRDCPKSFTSVCRSLQGGSNPRSVDLSAVELEDELGKFRVWAGNIGATQRGHSSLEYRLREAPLVLETVLKLLKELVDSLHDLNAILAGDDLQDDGKGIEIEHDQQESIEVEFLDNDSDSNEEPATQVQQLFGAVVDIVDNLYKLSIHIRNLKSRTNYSKATTFKAIDKDSGIDLVTQYEFFDIRHVQSVFAELCKEHPKEAREERPKSRLIDRLGKANTKRRQQFMYWEKHRDKLTAESLVKEGPVVDKYPFRG